MTRWPFGVAQHRPDLEPAAQLRPARQGRPRDRRSPGSTCRRRAGPRRASSGPPRRDLGASSTTSTPGPARRHHSVLRRHEDQLAVVGAGEVVPRKVGRLVAAAAAVADQAGLAVDAVQRQLRPALADVAGPGQPLHGRASSIVADDQPGPRADRLTEQPALVARPHRPGPPARRCSDRARSSRRSRPPVAPTASASAAGGLALLDVRPEAQIQRAAELSRVDRQGLDDPRSGVIGILAIPAREQRRSRCIRLRPAHSFWASASAWVPNCPTRTRQPSRPPA